MPRIYRKKKLVLWPFLISFALLTSCATQPPDVPVFEHYAQRIEADPVTDHMLLLPSPLCMEKIGEFECGHGVYIISGREIWVGEKKPNWFHGKPWSQLKRESIIMPAVESFAPISEYIINSCAQSQCNNQVDRYRVQLDELKGIRSLIRGQ